MTGAGLDSTAKSCVAGVILLPAPLSAPRWFRRRIAPRGGSLDRFDDELVAGAAAEVAGEHLADLGLVRLEPGEEVWSKFNVRNARGAVRVSAEVLFESASIEPPPDGLATEDTESTEGDET